MKYLFILISLLIRDSLTQGYFIDKLNSNYQPRNSYNHLKFSPYYITERIMPNSVTFSNSISSQYLPFRENLFISNNNLNNKEEIILIGDSNGRPKVQLFEITKGIFSGIGEFFRGLFNKGESPKEEIEEEEKEKIIPKPKPRPPVSTCLCAPIYEPVCGENGSTYINDCLRKCANVNFDFFGQC